jgi:hypothetical protein
MTTVRLYGLAVRSQVPLHQSRAVTDGRPDLDIALGAQMARTHATPPGRVLLDLRAHRQYYTATETPTGYHLRFYGTCDVVLSADLATARVHLVDGADPDVLSVLLAGTVMAFVLAMRGEPVLHASAVETAGRALAFVGASGMGKSTLATLMCASGARAITDDLLRLDLAASPPRCALGASELRLRQGSVALAAQFDASPPRRRTADARDALTVPASKAEGLPLAAIVVPLPDRSSTQTAARVDRLDPKSAFLLLSRFPRLLGWQDKSVLRRQFQHLGEIVGRVPVHLAVLPWGPPFGAGTAEAILRAVGMHGDVAHPNSVRSATSYAW